MELAGTSAGTLVRRIRYRCPDLRRTFVYLTNEMNLPPGLIAFLYRVRWNIEKAFDETKNRFREQKSRASSATAKTNHARFVCLAYNLTLLMETLLAKLKADASCEVITELEQLRERLEGAARESVQKEVNYLQSHRERMDYGTAKKKGEPLGSGAMESTCRQYQTRFKRTGQFWSQTGDEALMCLETFRRNGRWHCLFPHAQPLDPSKN